jgi:hypothetical protein
VLVSVVLVLSVILLGSLSAALGALAGLCLEQRRLGRVVWLVLLIWCVAALAEAATGGGGAFAVLGAVAGLLLVRLLLLGRRDGGSGGDGGRGIRRGPAPGGPSSGAPGGRPSRATRRGAGRAHRRRPSIRPVHLGDREKAERS